ncbi:MAG: sugar phosphate isomerase/epimerase [Oscillospiraceae bacterium]|nr:sugar phosphate isomerase/epimerase [Oscillospiraceae bacterium]
MKIGINVLLWTRQPSTEHIPLVHRIKEYGYDGVEFNVNAIKSKDASALADTIKELDLDVTTIMTLPTPVEAGDPTSADKQMRSKAVDWIKRRAETAKQLGASVVGGPITECLNIEKTTEPSEDEIKSVVETLHDAAEFAQTIGIKLACEIINRYEAKMANTVDQMLNIVNLSDMPNVGLHVDTYHSNIEELDVNAAWKKAGDRVFLVHISENDRGIPGAGHAAPPSIFETLREISYSDMAVIEAFFMTPGDTRKNVWRKYARDEEEIALNGLAYIRKYW